MRWNPSDIFCDSLCKLKACKHSSFGVTTQSLFQTVSKANISLPSASSQKAELNNEQ